MALALSMTSSSHDQGGDSPRIVGRSGAACGLDVPYLTLQCCKPLAQRGRVRDDGLDFLPLLGLQRGEGLDGLKRPASVLLQALFYGVDSGRHSFQGPVYLFPGLRPFSAEFPPQGVLEHLE